MTTQVINLSDAGSFVGGKLTKEIRKAAIKGLHKSAIRSVQTIQTRIIPRLTPKPVDRGIYRAGWKYDLLPESAEIYNDEHHAPFIEFGVRGANVKIGRAMIEALTLWVQRKGITSGFGEDEEEDAYEAAQRIAWAIAYSLQRFGIFKEGQGYGVMELLRKQYLTTIIRTEVERQIKKLA